MRATEQANKIIKRVRRLFTELESKKFRDSYVESQINDGLAFQIRAMRNDRGWTQARLAEMLGTEQSAISRMENPDYGNYSLSTLKTLASTFDVALLVRFVPFSELASRSARITLADIKVPPYREDDCLQEYSAFDSDENVSNFYSSANWNDLNVKAPVTKVSFGANVGAVNYDA